MILSRFPAPSGSDPKKPPKYTYTGQSELVEEDGGWKIRFLTSGTFTLLSPAKTDIDVFLVGGGGGGDYRNGGGGGYTITYTLRIFKSVEYPVSIGAGGAGWISGTVATDGSGSAAFNQSAAGGKAGTSDSGGVGGSGGGGGITGYGFGGMGGSDGSGGAASSKRPGGAGQGRTTREFEEPDNTLYSGGGGGAGGQNSGEPGGAGGDGGGGHGGNIYGAVAEGSTSATFYGGGGGGMSGDPSGAGRWGKGYQGICIIRNHREVTA